MSLLILFTSTRCYVTVSDPGTGGAGGGSFGGAYKKHSYLRQPEPVVEEPTAEERISAEEEKSQSPSPAQQILSPTPSVTPKVLLREPVRTSFPSIEEVLSWQLDDSPPITRETTQSSQEPITEEPILVSLEPQHTVIETPLPDLILTDEEILILFSLVNS